MSGSTSNTFKLAASQAAALTFKHGSTSVMKLDTATSTSDSKTSGSLKVAGGVGVSGQVSADTMEVFATTASSSKTTGSLKVAGGVGVSGAVFADTVTVKAAAATLAQDASFSSLTVNPGAQTEAAAGTHALVTGTKFMTFAVAGGDGATTEAATVTIDGATTGAATSNYALLVTGNGDTSKFAGDVLVGADVTINGGDIDMSGSTSNTFKLAASQAAALTFKHGSTSVMKLDTRGTASTSASTGSVLVTGGVGISEQMTAKRLAVTKTQVQVTGSSNKAITMSASSSFIELTADASTDTNVVTMGAGSDGQLVIVKNSDGHTSTVNSANILAGEAHMFVYDSDGATWEPLSTPAGGRRLGSSTTSTSAFSSLYSDERLKNNV